MKMVCMVLQWRITFNYLLFDTVSKSVYSVVAGNPALSPFNPRIPALVSEKIAGIALGATSVF